MPLPLPFSSLMARATARAGGLFILACLFGILYIKKIPDVYIETYMSKTLSFLIAVIVILGAFLIVRYIKESAMVDSSKAKEAASEVDFHDWREFDSPTEDFKVLFPSLPQHAQDTFLDPKTNESRKYDTYVAADDHGQAFMINTITFPKNVSDLGLEKTLKDTVNEMVSRNKENKLQKMQVGNFKNGKAVDFAMKNDKAIINGKVLANKDTVYVLSIVSKQDSFNPAELEFFTNSFNMQKPSKKK